MIRKHQLRQKDGQIHFFQQKISPPLFFYHFLREEPDINIETQTILDKILPQVTLVEL